MALFSCFRSPQLKSGERNKLGEHLACRAFGLTLRLDCDSSNAMPALRLPTLVMLEAAHDILSKAVACVLRGVRDGGWQACSV